MQLSGETSCVSAACPESETVRGGKEAEHGQNTGGTRGEGQQTQTGMDCMISL